jgi:hypothetical protein
MDSNNQITISGEFIDQYISFIKEITTSTTSVSSSTVKGSISKLTTLGLIVKGPGNSGLYFVNPKYASQVSEAKRKEVVQRIVSIQKQNRLPFNQLLNFSFENNSADDKQ